MTTKRKQAPLARTQLAVLIEISRGNVSIPGPGIDLDMGTWRLAGPTGRAVTSSVNALIEKGYARMSTEVVDDRRHAVATAAGHEALSRQASRGH